MEGNFSTAGMWGGQRADGLGMILIRSMQPGSLDVQFTGGLAFLLMQPLRQSSAGNASDGE